MSQTFPLFWLGWAVLVQSGPLQGGPGSEKREPGRFMLEERREGGAPRHFVHSDKIPLSGSVYKHPPKAIAPGLVSSESQLCRQPVSSRPHLSFSPPSEESPHLCYLYSRQDSECFPFLHMSVGVCVFFLAEGWGNGFSLQSCRLVAFLVKQNLCLEVSHLSLIK